MISALLLAAAVQLTPVELNQLLDKDPEIISAMKIEAIARRNGGRSFYCDAEKSTLDAASWLQSMVDRGELFTVPGYKLSPEDMKIIQDRQHQLEFHARQLDIDCRG